MWRSAYDLSGIDLEVGMEVKLSGHPNVYGPTGRLSFVASTAELVRRRGFEKAYEALKKNSRMKACSRRMRKRAPPEFIHKIGVVHLARGCCDP